MSAKSRLGRLILSAARLFRSEQLPGCALKAGGTEPADIFSLVQRLEQRIASVRIKHDRHSRRDVVRQLEELFSCSDGHQQQLRTAVGSRFHDGHRVVNWLDRTAQVQSSDNHESPLETLLEKGR